MKKRVLITPTWAFGRFSSGCETLRNNGIEPFMSPFPHPLTEEQLLELIPEFDGVILGLDPFTRKVFERATKLMVISRYGVGVDNVDIEEATRRGIVVANAPGTNDNAVAELAIGLMFALARNLIPLHKALTEGRWEKNPGIELQGKTLGVIGVGRIGQRVIRKARALGMNVLGYDAMPVRELERELSFQYVPLDLLLRESDFVSIHLPLSEKTRGLIGERELSLMKESAFLINTARGGIVDEEALYKVLARRRIRGAALDVFSSEPPFGNPLLRLDNVILLPHIGADTEEALRLMDEVSVENVIRVLQGGVPLCSVNFHEVQRKKRNETQEVRERNDCL